MRILLSIMLLGLAFSVEAQQFSFDTKYLKLTLNQKGNIIQWLDKNSKKDYFPQGESVALLSLYDGKTYHQPTSLTYTKSASAVSLRFDNGSIAIVSIAAKGDYLRLQMKSLEPRNNIQAIVWGPYATTIRESIGETICVVHDGNFAIGMQALDINTIEGLPEGNDNAGGGTFIDPLPGQTLPDSLKDQVGKEVSINVNVTGDMPAYVRMYRGTAAVKKPYGSELRLFSRDRRMARIVENGLTNEKGSNTQYVQPIDVDFAGSAIALFGCPEKKVLDVIEKIELGEKLPHPMLENQWVKRSKVPGAAYLMYEGKDMEKGFEMASKFGFELIHIGDLFQSWGHFGLQTARFPAGASDIRKLTEKGWSKNIALGVHTLSMFTGTNDSYVSPIPSDSLAKAGTAKLLRDISATDDEIMIDSVIYFQNKFGTHTVKINKELINYREASKSSPFKLTGCRRGQYGTTASAHAAGSTVDKLVNNDYNGFYPNIHLQDNFAKRMAEVCNETGLGLMDFDGYGGESPTGHGAYGAARFIDLWYRTLDKYVLTCGAGTFHYYWHIYSFMNWGEPWYNALRQSQVNYRIENQRYFERNYMPHMLGWFSIGADYRPEDVEWIQARSAAFNAGYLLRVDESLDKNGFRDQIFTTVRNWQNARKAGAFSKAQVEKLRNPENEFHLQPVQDGKWNMFPVTLAGGFEHKFRRVQTGEPVADKFNIKNPYAEQPVRFYASVTSVEGNTTETISNIMMEVNGYQSILINETLKAGDKIICDGKSIAICDANWMPKKTLAETIPVVFKPGENEIKVSSEFSGNQAPFLRFEFKFLGAPEIVSADTNK